MHRLSLQSLLAVSALVSGIAAKVKADGDYQAVTVLANQTFTSRPSSSSPAPCSSSSPSGSPSSASSIRSTATSSAGIPACTDFWLEKIKHQGVAPFSSPDYDVFRNVKDYGAKGDGVSDDTDAINQAISEGKRCGPGCTGSTKTPGLVYFPPGTYMVSSPIVDFYYTQLVGNPGCMPVLKATSNFTGRWLLDANQYGENGLSWGATNVFWRQVANLVIDITNVSPKTLISGIHWPSSQATSLTNIVFRSSEAKGNLHQGLFIEEGSGGYMGDLVFFGGAQAMSIGNQQFTMRNITVHNAKTAIQQLWSWGWTYKGVSINNCEVGFDFTAADKGNLNVGSITILDSEIKNTPVGITYGSSNATGPAVANNFIFENLRLHNVPTAIRGPSGTELAGSSGTSVIKAWGRGNEYTASSGPTFFEGPIKPNKRPASLVAGTAFYERSKPQYENVPLTEFVSARSAGAKGDNTTDDTHALNALFASAAAANKIVFLDAGMYLVTDTLRIPAGSRIFGEAFPVILSSGPAFASASSPKPVVQVGAAGERGRIEWSNTIVSTRGSQAGAILIEYNLASRASAPSGLWDVHTRIGGFAGSDLQLAQCAKTPDTPITTANLPAGCVAAFMSMHVTRTAAALYMENCWIWVADHDIEEGANNQQITVYAGRGLLVDGSPGPLWLVGTSVEHHQLYEYQFAGAADVFMGQIQTETAYYQPNPDARVPFAALERYRDPVLAKGESGWGLRVVDSTGLVIYGAGLYSFFDNYDVNCSQIGQGATCQQRIFSVEGASDVRVYNLNTVGTKKMVTVDGVDVADYEDNIDGFVHSIALFGVDA
ncbi:pectate lyase superfamily protein-domain-containing protein [Chaetomium sp. MPI-CAGE-AT-0009]|nr:pectate lyase superfamily protein-domain-containing protein [Chaetomium sp. MPI-CAGE-AT-0009]